jgi:hypothetical protein
MNELELIKVTQYAFAILGKSLPKGCVLKASGKNVVEFHKYDREELWIESGRPVGFYFNSHNTYNHRYELRSKYDGHELISFQGEELDKIIEDVNS